MPVSDGSNQSGDASGFIETLDRLSTLETVTDALGQALGSYGIEHLIVGGAPPDGHAFGAPVIASRWPRAFFMLYVENDYARVDPLIRRAARSHMPFEWSTDFYLANGDARVAEVMRRAGGLGTARGISGAEPRAERLRGPRVDGRARAQAFAERPPRRSPDGDLCVRPDVRAARSARRAPAPQTCPYYHA